MKTALNCVLLSLCAAASIAFAAEPKPKTKPAKEVAEVQKDTNSIVANCEKKKLPAEQEIECIEQGFLEFMEEMAAQRAASLR
ncbi:MAG TPA: hypothetical protein VEB70_10435 [Noviherbaspirillum sp.]|nr:hypothetical protein [Noviherbaspirillum sp.]